MVIKVLTIDDHALFRCCMVDFLDAIDDISVVGEAASPEQGLTMALELDVDVILVDLDLGGRDGMKLAEEILTHKPETAVVILTACKEEDQMARALQIGAKAYIQKDIAPDDLVQEIRKIVQGKVIYPQTFLLNQARNNLSRGGDAGGSMQTQLTPREREVLQCMCEGLTDKGIAKDLSVSDHTIKNHMKSIRKKLGASNRVQASKKGIALGIVKR